MWTNASVTITRRGDAYDSATGYRKDTTATAVLTAVRCCLSQNPNASRMVNKDGVRDYAKPVFSLLIAGHPSADLRTGDQATVAPDSGPTWTFTLNDAVYTNGIGESHWECNMERIDIPAA